MNKKKSQRMRAIARNHGLLVILLAVGIAVSLAMDWCPNSYIKGLGPNLLAGFIGSAVSVYGIDHLQRRRQMREQIPLLASCAEQVHLLSQTAIEFWRQAYQASVADGAVQSLEDLFAPSSIEKIKASLYMNAQSDETGKDWSQRLTSAMYGVRVTASEILDRYATVVPPDVHRAIHVLAWVWLEKLVDMVRSSCPSLGYPIPDTLGGYWPEKPDWFEAVLTLHQWTEEIHRIFLDAGITFTNAPYKFIPPEQTDNPPARRPVAVYMGGGV
jgi:hypothetical protein